jgi:hypothetical protein
MRLIFILGIKSITVLLVLSLLASNSFAQSAALGINLSSVTYYTPEQPFLNIMKTASGWSANDGSGKSYDQSQLDLDANGYPKSMKGVNSAAGVTFTQIQTLVLRNLGQLSSYAGNRQGPPYYRAGQYILLYDGEGTTKYSFDAKTYSRTSGRDILAVTPSGAGINVIITATDPNHTGNYIRNMRLVYASYASLLDSGEIFNPDFIARIRPFRTLRFMDWMQTNGSTEGTSWAARTPSSYAFWGRRSVPIEVMIALCNKLQADCWFNMPALATDDYVTQFATLVHSQLNSRSKVYVEFSNEIWNFSQNRQPLVAPGRAAFPGCATDDFCAGFNYGILRAIRVGKIWKNVWGADERRVVRVLAGQAGYTDRSRYMLDFKATQSGGSASYFNGPASVNVDVFAIAPYFGGGIASEIMKTAIQGVVGNLNTPYHLLAPSVRRGVESYISANVTVADVVARAQAAVRTETVVWTAATYSLTSTRSIPLVAYEGGQHLVAGGGLENCVPLVDLLMAANRDPGLGTATRAFLQAWKQNSGGGLMSYYADIGPESKWGSWGALENVMQASSPKYDALIEFTH